MLPHHAFFFHQIIKRASQNREYKCSTYSVSSLESSSKRPGDRLLNLFPPKSLLFPITQVADKKKRRRKRPFFPLATRERGKQRQKAGSVGTSIAHSFCLVFSHRQAKQTQKKSILTDRSTPSGHQICCLASS